MKKGILIFLIFLIIFLGGYFIFLKKKPGEKKIEELNIYNWEDYFAPLTIENFEKEFNIKVNLETFEDEEEMFSVVESNLSKYDLVIGSDTIVKRMIDFKIVAPLELNKIENFKNIKEEFKNPFYDPGNNYSIPYLWGTTGIVYNQKFIKEIKTWKDFFNFKGIKAMLNNHREVIGAGLKSFGYSLNTKDEKELEETKLLLLEQKGYLIGYLDPVEIKEKLISEDLAIAQLYSGDALSTVEKNENLVYLIPEEGATIWIDNFIIPKKAKNKKNAFIFINYLLRPEINAEIVNFLWYASPNKEAEKFIKKEILEDESVYPKEEVYKKLELIKEVREDNALYNKVWAEIQK